MIIVALYCLVAANMIFSSAQLQVQPKKIAYVSKAMQVNGKMVTFQQFTTIMQDYLVVAERGACIGLKPNYVAYSIDTKTNQRMSIPRAMQEYNVVRDEYLRQTVAKIDASGSCEKVIPVAQATLGAYQPSVLPFFSAVLLSAPAPLMPHIVFAQASNT